MTPQQVAQEVAQVKAANQARGRKVVPEQVVEAYLRGEGGYRILSRRFGVTQKTIKYHIQRAAAGKGRFEKGTRRPQ